MKKIQLAGLLFFLLMLPGLHSCSNETDPTDDTEQTTDDTVDPTDDTTAGGGDGDLQFTGTRVSVTFDLCELPFCSISQLVFLDENIGYAVTGVYVYKSIDGGETWEYLINQDITGKLIALSENLLFLNTYDGILKTTNGGDSWNNIERPLEFLCDGAGINTGYIQFVDEVNGFVQDRCEFLELYSTVNAGDNWNLILTTSLPIEEYYFEDRLNGLVRTEDELLVTSDGGGNWSSLESMPSLFNYVIARDGFFEFPDGSANIEMPLELSASAVPFTFDVNALGDISAVFFDEEAGSERWQLYLYVQETASWILVDSLEPLSDPLSSYITIHMTDAKTMFIGISRSGEILKYFVE
ncbi:WD40/YVTN/BNR-like repeat-containing protein [Gilvibacter sp.]|uniref:WD40/YVTN/BNR-like repeat-containing protein n=1 Tax=Gilvibacter sp. TaxID=2729997 RepID=UPI003F49C091